MRRSAPSVNQRKLLFVPLRPARLFETVLLIANLVSRPLLDHTSARAPLRARVPMTTKGPFDQETWSPWLSKVTYKAPKAMSLQAFKMALLKKRLAEAKATSGRAAETTEARAEAAADEEAIRAELRAAKEREERMKHVKAHCLAAETAAEAREAADKASAKVERLREEFEEEEREIVAKSKREQEARARALLERERKRAEQRAKLEEELERREGERHKQVLKLKDTLKLHADAKRKIAEDAAPEEGELNNDPSRNGGATNQTGNPFEDGPGPGPSPRFREQPGGGGGFSPRMGMGGTPVGSGNWGTGETPLGSGNWGAQGGDFNQGSGNWGAQGGDFFKDSNAPSRDFNQRGGQGQGQGQGPSGPRGEIRYGDWQCPKGCGNVFASKLRCFRCGAPKPAGGGAHHNDTHNPHAAGGGAPSSAGWGERPRMGGGRGNW